MTTDVSVVRDGTKMPGAVARVPKYYRVKQQVVEITESLTPGERLPAERLLALRLDTSRTTVLQAPQQLVGEGGSDRIQGKGTLIARPKLHRTLHLTSCTEDMPAQGLQPASRIIDTRHINADEELSRRLTIGIGEEVVLIERLRLTDDEPTAVESTHPRGASPVCSKRRPGTALRTRHSPRCTGFASRMPRRASGPRSRTRARPSFSRRSPVCP